MSLPDINSSEVMEVVSDSLLSEEYVILPCITLTPHPLYPGSFNAEIWIDDNYYCSGWTSEAKAKAWTPTTP
jgi:hypothetical protein